MVDISTPATVLDKLSEVLKDHMEKEAAEFKTDSALISFTAVGDPLKVQLLVCFDYSHNGESCYFPAGKADFYLILISSTSIEHELKSS